LAGADYPATKEQFLEHARRRGTNKDVLDALRSISDGEYDGPNKVCSAIPKHNG
jgi:hypothetical protein